MSQPLKLDCTKQIIQSSNNTRKTNIYSGYSHNTNNFSSISIITMMMFLMIIMMLTVWLLNMILTIIPSVI